MDGIEHDGAGNATIMLTAADIRELYGRCTGIEPLRPWSGDPVWGLADGDPDDPQWDEATAFWCPTEVAAQLVAAYESAHGYETFGSTAMDHGNEVCVVVSSRP